MTEPADELQGEESLIQVERKLAAVTRVAAEAMRMLTDEQLAELVHRLDALEVGDSGSEGRRR